jgi:CDP-4-dehydro-6-deoxyglucose reductase
MPQQYYEAELIDIIDETASTKRFYFRVPHLDKFHFKPGQFVMLDLPIESKITNRSYSIASAPSDNNIFELVIVLNPPGLGTPYMWENYKIGMKVPVAGPLGKFVLPEKIENDICFIATGTGIAPLRSMVHHILNNSLERRNLYMVFGSRKQQDLLYHQEMLDYQQKHPEFKFIPVLSREEPSTWAGKHGYVHSVYEEIFADRRKAHFYICGWKAMIMEARDRLTQMGYGKEHIKYELYD